jgi:hypothetical protein
MKAKTTAERLRHAVQEYGRRPVLERADDMVERGVVNRNGELTTNVGGSAEPEAPKK